MKIKLITYPNQPIGALDRKGHLEFTFKNGKVFLASASEQEMFMMILGFPLTLLLLFCLKMYDIVSG